ncbi:class I SAM-dependent methyltransferase [Aquimarina sp. 2201CG14-23]|uniref:class I SAM-dependent methyltransferase n=1 Tax=Aquimarina mycalae TaxID=3040073 RepID=UPI002477D13E|nr:class I SAM-dependent methyltransferase [Aquimarina sp. 2201CG14-23]MDH7447169.1 class I SAM-dependent methyltransferase [Aquimarina sp. 2201CG14-23]
MNPYKKTFETYNKIASLYEEVFRDIDLYNDTYTLFCNELSHTNPFILEIGCGPGNITKHLVLKRPDAHIIGIDIAPNMVKLAQKNNPSVSFKVMDGRRINTLKSKFNGIICGFYLPYISISDRIGFIKDCANLLLDQGILYISFVEGDHRDSGYQTGSSGDQVYFNYHNINHLKKELTTFQFSTIHIIHKDYPKKDGTIEIHTILIARKNDSG